MSIERFCVFVVLLAVTGTAAGCATSSPAPGDSRTPYGATPHAVPGVVEAEHFDEGAPGLAYSDIDEINHGAPYRGVTQVDIEQRGDASNGYGVGWIRAGEWIGYTIRVKKSGVYTIEMPVASQKAGGLFHIEVDGVDVSGPMRIPDTGAWTTLEVIRAKTVRLEAGVRFMKVVMDANGESGAIGDIDYFRFVVVE